MLTALFFWTATLAHAGWREDLPAALAGCAVDPTPCEVVESLQVRTTRSGHLVTQDARLSAEAAPILLARLLEAGPSDRRVALAEGLTEVLLDSQDLHWGAGWAELASADADPAVRSILVLAMRRAAPEIAHPGLLSALSHPEAQTRAEAAHTLGGRSDGARFAAQLRAALADPAADVRAEAAKALGWLADQPSRSALEPLVQDADPTVRANAQRALERLDR